MDELSRFILSARGEGRVESEGQLELDAEKAVDKLNRARLPGPTTFLLLATQALVQANCAPLKAWSWRRFRLSGSGPAPECLHPEAILAGLDSVLTSWRSPLERMMVAWQSAETQPLQSLVWYWCDGRERVRLRWDGRKRYLEKPRWGGAGTAFIATHRSWQQFHHRCLPLFEQFRWSPVPIYTGGARKYGGPDHRDALAVSYRQVDEPVPEHCFSYLAFPAEQNPCLKQPLAHVTHRRGGTASIQVEVVKGDLQPSYRGPIPLIDELLWLDPRSAGELRFIQHGVHTATYEWGLPGVVMVSHSRDLDFDLSGLVPIDNDKFQARFDELLESLSQLVPLALEHVDSYRKRADLPLLDKSFKAGGVGLAGGALAGGALALLTGLPFLTVGAATMALGTWLGGRRGHSQDKDQYLQDVRGWLERLQDALKEWKETEGSSADEGPDRHQDG